MNDYYDPSGGVKNRGGLQWMDEIFKIPKHPYHKVAEDIMNYIADNRYDLNGVFLRQGVVEILEKYYGKRGGGSGRPL